MEKILIVDDEQDICEILQFNLETEGYDVDVANSAEEALGMQLNKYNLLLLDVMMGEISGFQMVRTMKKNPTTANIPVIFITALDDENNIIKGLNIGADDYIVKPLSVQQVKARVKAVLRRTKIAAHSNDNHGTDLSPRAIIHETLYIEPEKKKICIDNEEIQLTKLEFEILHMMLKHPGKVYSREMIIEKIWPKDTVVLDRTVDVNITRIRKKLRQYGKCLKTRFGYGYTFEP